MPIRSISSTTSRPKRLKPGSLGCPIRLRAPRTSLRRERAKLDRKFAAKFPAVIFGRRDDIVAEYLKRVIGLEAHEYPCHIVPSTADLLAFVLSGYGYSLLPELQIELQLDRGKLVDLHPKATHVVDLFWHKWKISTDLIKTLTENVKSAAKKHLGNA